MTDAIMPQIKELKISGQSISELQILEIETIRALGQLIGVTVEVVREQTSPRHLFPLFTIQHMREHAVTSV